jgi:20S proteasome subunit beta 7
MHSWVTHIQYTNRSRMSPLWCHYLVVGTDPHTREPFIGNTGMLGTAYTADCSAVGFGKMLVLGLLREHLEKRGGWQKLTKSEALDVLQEAMEMLYYRDTHAFNRYQCYVVGVEGGVEQYEDLTLKREKWECAGQYNNYQAPPWF